MLDNPTTLTDPSGLHGECSGEVSNGNGGCEGAAIPGALDKETQTGTALTNKHHSSNPVNSAQGQKVAVIYGETSGLRPELNRNGKINPASAADLKKARENIADVFTRNKRVYMRTPSPAELKNPQVRRVWQESQAAAAASNGSLPGKYFFIRQNGAGRQRPSRALGWGQGKTVHEYGPFINVGGGDVPGGPGTYIDIYNQ